VVAVIQSNERKKKKKKLLQINLFREKRNRGKPSKYTSILKGHFPKMI